MPFTKQVRACYCKVRNQQFAAAWRCILSFHRIRDSRVTAALRRDGRNAREADRARAHPNVTI